jgi:hypothetical protein
MSQENVETITRLYAEFLSRPERVGLPILAGDAKADRLGARLAARADVELAQDR